MKSPTEVSFTLKKRYGRKFTCENSCSGHGVCDYMGDRCHCEEDINGDPLFCGVDCSMRTCPRGLAWQMGDIARNNEAHALAECSNRGTCDRDTGECECWSPFEGHACQRIQCPNECNRRGQCLPQKLLASMNNRVYSTPWDSSKVVGCVCDVGYRGHDCALQECPSGPDPLGGYGNEAGRDCSGRGHCDYSTGLCKCYAGFIGVNCGEQLVLF